MKQKKALTKAEMRVAVAKDVIQQIKLGKYVPKSRNGYIQFKTKVRAYFKKLFNRSAKYESPAFEPISSHMGIISSEPCTVCAKGAAVLSYARLFNKAGLGLILNEDGLEGKDPFDDNDSPSPWNEIFGDDAVDMENAFEGKDPFDDNDSPSPWNEIFGDDEVGCDDSDCDGTQCLSKFALWSHKHPDDKDRLVAIMKNIIRNEGDFLLDDI